MSLAFNYHYCQLDLQLALLLWSTARGIIVISIPIVICTIFVIYDNTPQPLRYDVYKESSLKTQTCFGKLCISNVCHLSKYNDTPICMSKHVGWVESLKDIVCWCYGVIVAISYKTASGRPLFIWQSRPLLLPNPTQGGLSTQLQIQFWGLQDLNFVLSIHSNLDAPSFKAHTLRDWVTICGQWVFSAFL